MRAVNPATPLRRVPRSNSRKLVSQGTKLLAGLKLPDAERQQFISVWKDLQTSWDGTEADRRTALTRFDDLLRWWTGHDADFASIESAQAYRKRLHFALEHS